MNRSKVRVLTVILTYMGFYREAKAAVEVGYGVQGVRGSRVYG